MKPIYNTKPDEDFRTLEADKKRAAKAKMRTYGKPGDPVEKKFKKFIHGQKMTDIITEALWK